MASSATGALSINSQLGGSLFTAGWQFIFNCYVTCKVCVNDQFLPKYRGNTNCNTYTLHWRVRRNTFHQLLSLCLPFCLTISIPLCYVWHAPYHAVSFFLSMVAVTKQYTLDCEVFLTISQSSLCVLISVLSLVGV